MNNIVDWINGKCCGCTACSVICPFKCININTDSKGFLYPEIKNDACVECGLCRKVCPNNTVTKEEPKELWGVHHLNISERKTSRSGAIFMALGEVILQSGGVVYGAGFTEELKVCHMKIEDRQALHKLKGSKYVQSQMGTVYEQVCKDLRESRKVLFSGTGCQVAGLLNLLKMRRIQTETLITCDIICHGVPSHKIYDDYRKCLEQKYHSKVVAFDFRDKVLGWRAHIESFTLQGGRKIMSETYTDIFYQNVTLCPSCFSCAYADFKRPGDVTIGDLWGANSLKGWIDNIGNSLVLINTNKGKQIFEKCRPLIDIRSLKKEECMQPNLVCATPKPAIYDDFWNLYFKEGFYPAARMIQKRVRSERTKGQKIKYFLKVMYIRFWKRCKWFEL